MSEQPRRRRRQQTLSEDPVEAIELKQEGVSSAISQQYFEHEPDYDIQSRKKQISTTQRQSPPDRNNSSKSEFKQKQHISTKDKKKAKKNKLLFIGVAIAILVILFLLAVGLFFVFGPMRLENMVPNEKPFILRSGIEFGDTVEEVKQKETTLDFVSHTPVNEENEFEKLNYAGTVSGVESSQVDFVFADGKLVSMLYTLGDGFVADGTDGYLQQTLHSLKRLATLESYDNVRIILTDKYGVPLTDTCDYYGEKLGGILKSQAFSSIMGTSFGYHDDLKYNEWFIPAGKDYVKIDQLYVEDIESWCGSYDHYLEYTLVSRNEIIEDVVDNANLYNTIANDL